MSTEINEGLPVAQQPPLQRMKRRHADLLSARSTHDPVWKELSENILPRRARFFTSEANKGTKKETKIYNSTPTAASRTQSAGMMSSISSPARKWMKLTTEDIELRELEGVKLYLDQVEEKILATLKKSNVYNCLHNVYGDIGTFSVAALMLEEDDETVIRGKVFPIGSYCLGQNAKGIVDTCFREYRMTTRQLVEEFTAANCSAKVQDQHRVGRFEEEHDVVFAIYPNADYEEGRLGAKGMPFSSCWYEKNSSEVGPDAKFLHEGGFEEWPLPSPRWSLTGEDVYGSCPGTEALGDAKMLQLLEKRKMQAVDKVVNPPMRAPTSLIGQRSSLLPGDVTHVDGNGAGQKFEPAMEIQPQALNEFREAIRECEARIKDAYFATLWLIMQRIDAGKMTATEVSARQQEQMLLLGPVMERLEDELLSVLIMRVYGILLRKGLLPEPPEELQGQALKIVYVSVMAQAQKLLGTANIERLVSFAGSMSAVFPDVVDKIDADQVMDEYGDAVGVPSRIIRSDDKVAEVRAARAQQVAAAQQAEKAAAMVQGAKVLSETDTASDNALTRLLGGVSSPSAA